VTTPSSPASRPLTAARPVGITRSGGLTTGAVVVATNARALASAAPQASASPIPLNAMRCTGSGLPAGNSSTMSFVTANVWSSMRGAVAMLPAPSEHSKSNGIPVPVPRYGSVTTASPASLASVGGCSPSCVATVATPRRASALAGSSASAAS